MREGCVSPLETARELRKQCPHDEVKPPPTPIEVLRVTTSRWGPLVQSAEDLCEIVIEALHKYENELHGKQTPVQFLWAKQPGGMFAPVDENTLSDHIKLFLERELSGSAIVLNHEVEVGRVAGDPVGNGTDIKIDADWRGDNSDGYDAIVTVIETKGCWIPDLLTAIEDRLRNDYVKRLGAPLGIYLIGWFDKEKGTRETIEEGACRHLK